MMNSAFGNIMNLYQQLQKNPMAVLSQRFNIPKDMNLNSPNDIIQHLLNTGQVSQAQLNNVMQMKDSPLIKQMFNIR